MRSNFLRDGMWVRVPMALRHAKAFLAVDRGTVGARLPRGEHALYEADELPKLCHGARFETFSEAVEHAQRHPNAVWWCLYSYDQLNPYPAWTPVVLLDDGMTEGAEAKDTRVVPGPGW